MYLKYSGSCGSTSRLSESECENSPYPSSSYKWGDAHDWPDNPKGCYVKQEASTVHFNKAADGKHCTRERPCLCKKGKQNVKSQYDVINMNPRVNRNS